MTLWMTGLCGSDKSTVGVVLEVALIEQGRAAYEGRDPKEFHEIVRANDVRDFFGLDAPYEKSVGTDLEADYPGDFEHSAAGIPDLIGVRTAQ